MFKFNLVYLPILLLAAMPPLWSQDGPSKASALTADQKQALQQKAQALESTAKAQMDKQNARIAEIAKNIDRNLLSGKPDEDLDRKLSADFAAEVTSMVNGAIQTKLSATKEMVKVLTPAQKAALLTELDKPGAQSDLQVLINQVLAR